MSKTKVEDLNKKRQKALDDLAEIVQHIYGDRCTRNEGGCPCCLAWTVYDAFEKMTDASYMDADFVKFRKSK